MGGRCLFVCFATRRGPSPPQMQPHGGWNCDPPFRTEGPLFMNPGEEPLQHEAGAEGLSIPVLNPCGTHQGGRVELWEQARGGKGSPTGS